MKVFIEGISHYLPENVISSLEIEQKLKNNYERFRFDYGRLEFFTGIRERKFWDDPTIKPSDIASNAAAKCLEQHNINADDIDILIFCSVCRDMLEPASSVFIHKNLKLPQHCINFDLSNACLGMISGIEVARAMIKTKRAKKALLVSGEIGYPLLQETIKFLKNPNLTRRQFKENFSSLTIGSAASAIVLSGEEYIQNKILEISHIENLSDTTANDLCQGNHHQQHSPLMQTNSQALLERGIQLAQKTWSNLQKNFPFSPDRVYHHQVGKSHTKALFESLNLDTNITYETFPTYGNCGSASLPITLALAHEQQHFKQDHKVALLGIGSGINCSMLTLQ